MNLIYPDPPESGLPIISYWCSAKQTHFNPVIVQYNMTKADPSPGIAKFFFRFFKKRGRDEMGDLESVAQTNKYSLVKIVNQDTLINENPLTNSLLFQTQLFINGQLLIFTI